MHKDQSFHQHNKHMMQGACKNHTHTHTLEVPPHVLASEGHGHSMAGEQESGCSQLSPCCARPPRVKKPNWSVFLSAAWKHKQLSSAWSLLSSILRAWRPHSSSARQASNVSTKTSAKPTRLFTALHGSSPSGVFNTPASI